MDDSRLLAIQDQLETLALLLVRPVVQQQIFLFLIITLIAWLIPIPYRLFTRWQYRRAGLAQLEQKPATAENLSLHARVVRILRATEFVIFPIAGLLLGVLVSGQLRSSGMPFGLFERLMRLYWLLLAYRVIVAVLYAILIPETALLYRRRFVAPVFIVLLAASLTIGLIGTFPLGEIELFQFMERPLTVGAIATSLVLFYLTFAFAWILRDVLHQYVLPKTSADAGVSHAIELVAHYSVIGIGIFLAANTLGFDLTALLVIFGGLSVGIGFGLQELVANFISGIMLVFEQTLRPGDVVEVEGQRGTVTQMNMRATVLRNIDNIELFIPNKTLLTSNVAAYTLTDRVVRRTLQVGVSYDSNPTQVRDILMAIAERHGLVEDDPPPSVFFNDFGDSSLVFELAVFIGEPMRVLSTLSDLRFMIYSDFAKNGIVIPFPQRDLNFPSQNMEIYMKPSENGADSENGGKSPELEVEPPEDQTAGNAKDEQTEENKQEKKDKPEKSTKTEISDPARLP